jgi:hypothetical protein
MVSFVCDGPIEEVHHKRRKENPKKETNNFGCTN